MAPQERAVLYRLPRKCPGLDGSISTFFLCFASYRDRVSVYFRDMKLFDHPYSWNESGAFSPSADSAPLDTGREILL